MSFIKRAVRQILRPRGWELRQFHPNIALDTYLWTLFAHLQINCVLDVGARVGEYGIFLRDNNYKGHIISFEPIEENFRRLKAYSQQDAQWSVHQYALGSSNQLKQINVSIGTSLSSFLLPSEYGKECHEGIFIKHTEDVKIHRLDEIVQQVTSHISNPRIYLKMDTQGWDLEVFRGAKGCMTQIVALQSELSLKPLYQEAIDWTTALAEYNEAGYSVSAFFGGWRDNNLRLSEMDCVMVRDR